MSSDAYVDRSGRDFSRGDLEGRYRGRMRRATALLLFPFLAWACSGVSESGGASHGRPPDRTEVTIEITSFDAGEGPMLGGPPMGSSSATATNDTHPSSGDSSTDVAESGG